MSPIAGKSAAPLRCSARLITFALALLPALVAVVAACAPWPAPTPAAPAAVASASAGAGKALDTVVLAVSTQPDNLHPYIGALVAKWVILQAVFPGCVAQNDKVEWIAVGCESVPTLENGGAVFAGDGDDRHLEVTFKIRKGWRWTDGTPVTAKDAVYLWQLLMDPQFPAQRAWGEKLYDVVAAGDNTIVYKFLSHAQAKAAEAGTLTGNVPFAAYQDDYIANNFSASGGPVVDSAYFSVAGWLPSAVLSTIAPKDQATSDFAKMPMGDGPYVVKEWKDGQEIALVKSDQPYPLGDAKITNIVYRFIPNAQSVVAALQAGEIDGVTSAAGLSASSARDLDTLAAGGAYTVSYLPLYAWEHIDLNTTKFPLDDVRVRRALYSAIDKQTIVDTLYSGKYYPVELPGAVLPGNSWAYTSDYTKYPFDLKAAALLLQQAGWDCKALPCTKQAGGETKKLEITLMTTDRSDRQQLAQVIQAMWKALNVGVNLQLLNSTALFAACKDGGPLSCRTFDAAIFTWLGSDDPSFTGLYNCAAIPSASNDYSAGANFSGWCNPEADKALVASEATAGIAVSQEKRLPYLATFFKSFTADAPVIPLYVNSVPIVHRSGFKNYRCGPTGDSGCAWNVQEWELTR